MERNKIEYLVVDTGAFLKNAAIQELAENVITCQDVINEVTSKRQLRRLVVLPYELQIKDVFPENVQFVTEFSKKTGDYPSLSATDIKVIALTYQLEKEKVGVDHLRKAPEAQRTISFQNRPTVDPKDMAGFFIPSKKANEEDENCDGKNDEDIIRDETAEEKISLKLSAMSCTEDVRDDSGDEDCCEDTGDDTESDEEQSADQPLDEIDPTTILTKIPSAAVGEDTVGRMEREGSAGENEEEEEEDDASYSDDDDEEDEDAWITPGNIKEMKKQMNADFEEEKPVKVACITTDFAMQNVLKQIGLNVSSVDGRVIRQLRTFILRCYACFKTTGVMTKVFCPHCGHKTLKRVAVSVEPDGSQKIHINLKKPLTSRGKKFSLPTFQGGKHANNPVLYEDQPMPDQRPSRLARTKTNILDNDYIPGFSPFVMRDTTSKSAMLGIRGSREVKHWMRKNPNEVKAHVGRRKKK